MPDAGFHKILESESETLFSAADRSAGTTTQEFTMDGHTDLTVIQTSNFVDGATHTKVQLEIYDDAEAAYVTDPPYESITDIIRGMNSLKTATYDSKSKDISAQISNPTSAVTKPDGTVMFVLNFTDDTIYQYSMSTASDVSTLSYDSNSFALTTQETSPISIAISPDGTKLYAIGLANDTVYQYALSTGWDLSTISYDSKSLDVSGETTTAAEIRFKPDGTKMYLLMTGPSRIYQYTLGTAWDISTASYDKVDVDISSIVSAPTAMELFDDGYTILVTDDDEVYQLTMSEQWNSSTVTHDETMKLHTGNQTDNIVGVSVSHEDAKIYVHGNTNDTVYQYGYDQSQVQQITKLTNIPNLPSGKLRMSLTVTGFDSNDSISIWKSGGIA